VEDGAGRGGEVVAISAAALVDGGIALAVGLTLELGAHRLRVR
jgi:hypothetical protein